MLNLHVKIIQYKLNMYNSKITAMKTIIFLIVLMSLAVVCQAQRETDVSHVRIDESSLSQPVFLGHKYYADSDNTMSLKEYVMKNIERPQSAMEYCKTGAEVVSFVVTPDGEIGDIEVINSVCHSIDEEVIRVLSATSGMWKPAVVDGKSSEMQKELCIIFSPECENVLQDFCKCATRHFQKATVVMFEDKKYRKAERLFDKAMLYLPYDKATLLNRGFCRFAQGNYDGAFADWRRMKDLGSIDMTDSYAEKLRQLEGYTDLVTLLNE